MPETKADRLTEVELLEWQLWDSRVDAARLRFEKAEREAIESHNARSLFQQRVMTAREIDPALDRIGNDGAITRGPRPPKAEPAKMLELVPEAKPESVEAKAAPASGE